MTTPAPEQVILFAPALAAKVPLQTTLIVPLPPAPSWEVSQSSPVGRDGRLMELKLPAIVPSIRSNVSPARREPPMFETLSVPPKVTVPLLITILSPFGTAPRSISDRKSTRL